MEKRTTRVLGPDEKLVLPERYRADEAYVLILAREKDAGHYPKALVLETPEDRRAERLAQVKREYAVALAKDEAPQETALTVLVTGLRSTKGKVLLSLFDSAEGFPGQGERARVGVREIAAEKTAQYVFTGLKPGVYAAVLLHDENGNGKLDTGPFGIPREGFGASNNPKVRMGPPRFKDAAVAITGAGPERALTIKAIYL